MSRKVITFLILILMNGFLVYLLLCTLVKIQLSVLRQPFHIGTLYLALLI